MTDAELFALGEEMLAQDQSENIRLGERVTTPVRNPNPPTTIRMAPNLLKRLDRLAKAQHRTRSSLILHVLWEYVFEQDGIPDGSKTAKPKATAARTNGKKVGHPKARALKA
jgi:predicted transcriptional regulator